MRELPNKEARREKSGNRECLKDVSIFLQFQLPLIIEKEGGGEGGKQNYTPSFRIRL